MLLRFLVLLAVTACTKTQPLTLLRAPTYNAKCENAILAD